MSKPSRISAVVFDMDGLMFDTEALFHRVAAEMLAEHGKEFTSEMMSAMIGRRAVDAGAAFKRLSGLEGTVEDLMAELKTRFLAILDEAVQTTPGLFALLAHLKKLGIPRAVATSSRRDYAERLIGNHGMLDQFAFLLTAEDVTHGKPEPEIYLTAAARFGVDPSELLVLEDSPPGLTAAKRAGTFAVGVPHEHSPADGISHADLIVESLDDPVLLRLLETRGKPA